MADSNQQLKALCDEYAAQLPEKIKAVDLTWLAFKENKGLEELTLELIRKTHNLVGSGATFGFARLSEHAAEIETLLRQFRQNELTLQTTIDKIEPLLISLKHSALSSQQDSPTNDLDFFSPTVSTVQQGLKNTLLISSNQAFAAALAVKLKAYNIKLDVLTSTAELPSLQDEHLCILLDLNTENNQAIEAAFLTRANPLAPDQPHLIILSDQDNMLARLSAIRLGGSAFFTHPVNMVELIKTVREKCFEKAEPVYRVLIVDDDVQFSKHTALLLERAGIRTRVINDPMDLIEPLAVFQPDLILLDLHMPSCSGIELAAVIRQQCLYSGTSIVFFSVETDIDRHIDALRAGGNDFFIKGITPTQLIAKVEAKALQARELQTLMLNDPLTGLANRTNLSNTLSTLIASCHRHQRHFTYVMLDLDHFKQVNDQFGHHAGDEVLRALGLLIQQRLRSVDTAIRYGGEEIVILLPDTHTSEASIVIGELLQAFQELVFNANQQSFSVSFSAGIAEYPLFSDYLSLAEAADKALYKAKEGGRGRICLAW